MYPNLTTILSKYQKIILVGGGTGGHIQPIISLIQHLRTGELENLKIPKFLWIGGKNSQEEQAAKENSIAFVPIPTFKLSTTKSPKVLLYPFVLFKGILEARKILHSVTAEVVNQSRNKKPRSLCPSRGQKLENLKTGKLENGICIFSKGGPGSVAVGMAAWTLGIPLYIHESDTIPGRSNRLLGRFATTIFLGFERAKEYFNTEKCETVGQILNPVFEEGRMDSEEGRIRWGTKKKHLLVICGSQGSRAIFEEILKNLEEILKENELIIILGKLNTGMRNDFNKKIENLKTGKLENSIQLLDWIAQEQLASLIPDTDIAITRGSATTLAELTAFKNTDYLKTGKLENLKPLLIIIPLPYSADNHQYSNAKEYEKIGHILLEQKNFHLLTETIQKIGQNSRLSNT